MIKLTQNPNFTNWWKLENSKTNESDEIAGRDKALRVALKIAKRVGQRDIRVVTNKGWKLVEA